MSKKFRCRIGAHKWVATSRQGAFKKGNEYTTGVKVYKWCEHCGKKTKGRIGFD